MDFGVKLQSNKNIHLIGMNQVLSGFAEYVLDFIGKSPDIFLT